MAGKDSKKNVKAYIPGRLCPKCKSKLADHKDRHTCGRCGYTEWKRTKEEKDAKEE
jgi:small subunit ribosomal protein S27Ae